MAEFGGALIDYLGPNEAKTIPISMSISENAVKRTYLLTIEAKAGINKVTRQTVLYVSKKEASAIQATTPQSPLAGFLPLGFSSSAFAFVILIILIICLAIMVMYLLSGSNTAKRGFKQQPWVSTSYNSGIYSRNKR